MKLAESTWPEVAKLDRNLVVISPIAALEQHSRHLPFATDAILCGAVADRLEAALPKDTLLLPVQWLGASEHHLGMAGTLTVPAPTHAEMLCEPLRCLARAGFRKILILNGHGGNTDGWHLALRQLAQEFPGTFLAGVNYWDLAGPEIAARLEGKLKHVGHACEFETSLMMYLRPELVRRSEIVNDRVIPPPPALAQVYIPLDMRHQTHQGGNGSATLATAEKGQALLEIVVAKAVAAVKAIRAQPPGHAQNKF